MGHECMLCGKPSISSVDYLSAYNIELCIQCYRYIQCLIWPIAVDHTRIMYSYGIQEDGATYSSYIVVFSSLGIER